MAAMRRAARQDAGIASRVRHFLRTPEELYRYADDPDALHHLASDRASAERITRYRKRLLDHMRATGDPALPQFEAFLKAHACRAMLEEGNRTTQKQEP